WPSSTCPTRPTTTGGSPRWCITCAGDDGRRSSAMANGPPGRSGGPTNGPWAAARSAPVTAPGTGRPPRSAGRWGRPDGRPHRWSEQWGAPGPAAAQADPVGEPGAPAGVEVQVVGGDVDREEVDVAVSVEVTDAGKVAHRVPIRTDEDARA